MAYDLIPTEVSDILNKISHDAAQEASAVLLQLQKKFPSIKDPIAMDPTKPKEIKITRKLSESLDIKPLQKQFTKLKLSFGEGSRGGRGAQNKGNLFERELADDIEAWWRGEEVSSDANADLINDLIAQYGIDTWKELYVDAEGAENKPRPLMINGKSVLVSPGLEDIGAVVTDITLRKGKTKSSPGGVYLSLKYSGTVTFFNAGTKKYLTDTELQSGLIKNIGGLALLNLFGIDNALFCAVFNGTMKRGSTVNTTQKVNKALLENLIKSGIGYGFHMVHKKGSTIISKVVDQAYRDAASKVQSVIVFYGGKTGSGARVDIEVKTPKYILKFNFRNKQGGKYISHLMCDYSYV